MGREAVVNAQIGDQAGEVHALLESSELIMRGAIRRRFPKAALEQVRVDEGTLYFVCSGEAIRLELGARMAQSWCKAIATPAPDLRAKLGLHKGARALRVGAFDDAALTEALKGVLVKKVRLADMIIACIKSAADLDAALVLQAAQPKLPVWTIYGKGSGIPFGDSHIRTALRGAGFRDSKSCAVSERLTATRYNPSP